MMKRFQYLCSYSKHADVYAVETELMDTIQPYC